MAKTRSEAEFPERKGSSTERKHRNLPGKSNLRPTNTTRDGRRKDKQIMDIAASSYRKDSSRKPSNRSPRPQLAFRGGGSSSPDSQGRDHEEITVPEGRTERNPSTRHYEAIGAQERSFLAYLAFQEAITLGRGPTEVPCNQSQGRVPLPVFDGTGDPSEFLEAFMEGLEKMSIQPARMEYNYRRFFLDSLKGEARRWSVSISLNTCPPGELRQLFLERYASQIKHHSTKQDIQKIPHNGKDNTRRVKSPNEEKVRKKNCKAPAKRKSYPTGTSDKDQLPWCSHHQKRGHKTEECRQLGDRLVAAYKDLAKRERESGEEESNRLTNGASGAEQATNTYPPLQARSPPTPRYGVNMIMSNKGTSSQLSDQSHQTSPDQETFQKELVFTNSDLAGVEVPHSDLLVITLKIADYLVPRILVDTGSLADLISIDALQRIWSRDTKIKPRSKNLSSFGGENVSTVGTVKLPISIGGTLRIVEFDVIEKGMIYNVILGTPWLFSMKAVASTYHQCLKFPTSKGIYTVRGSQVEARRCLDVERALRPLRDSPQPGYSCPTSDGEPSSDTAPTTLASTAEGRTPTLSEEKDCPEEE